MCLYCLIDNLKVSHFQVISVNNYDNSTMTRTANKLRASTKKENQPNPLCRNIVQKISARLRRKVPSTSVLSSLSLLFFQKSQVPCINQRIPNEKYSVNIWETDCILILRKESLLDRVN